MSFSVVWKPKAEDELAALWTSALDRNAVTRAADRLDRALASDPLSRGESRTANYRLIFETPLAAIVEVDQPNQTVYVLAVGWSGRPG